MSRLNSSKKDYNYLLLNEENLLEKRERKQLYKVKIKFIFKS